LWGGELLVKLGYDAIVDGIAAFPSEMAGILLKNLEDPDPEVRVLAVRGLARLYSDSVDVGIEAGVIPALINALHNEDKSVVLAARVALTFATGKTYEDIESWQEWWDTQAPIVVKIGEAVAKGLVQADIYGRGLERVDIELRLISADPLVVVIPSGTIFQAQSPDLQNMIVRKKSALWLKSRDEAESLSVLAACANMERDVPGSKDMLSVSDMLAAEDLVALLDSPKFHRETFRVQQFAIWTITDNPRRYDYVRLGTFGFGTGPSDEEIERIRALFKSAGISIDKYRALQ
jgi:hypothetical protein